MATKKAGTKSTKKSAKKGQQKKPKKEEDYFSTKATRVPGRGARKR